MGRLIDADALKDTLGISDKDIEFAEMLDEQPTVDAEPVRHGHWIQLEFKSVWNNKLIACSKCGELFLVQHVESEHYCRNCGAKMDGEEALEDGTE